MVSLANLLPPIQIKFDEPDLRKMAIGRRQLSTEWTDVLRAPQGKSQDWCLILPFPNTFQNAFETMSSVTVLAHVSKKNGNLCLFLKGIAADEKPPQEIYDWITTIGKYVAMKDKLALSFALDFERKGGDPKEPQSKVGALRAIAKPYGRATATKETTAAADSLVERCIAFLKEMSCYESADCVAAVPPSNPRKPYNLPHYLAEKIAAKWGRADLSEHVRTIKARGSIKSTAVANKLDARAF
ncbi:MAG: hypothetical protein WBD46_12240 [Acidobacteriaceae bacterium]